MQWVYTITDKLSALCECRGVYGADLGPGPQDSKLATMAFGPNRPRLARLQRILDTQNVLQYICPLPRQSVHPKAVVPVTGESCAGKDYCADVWASVLSRPNITHHKQLTVLAMSISDATKRRFAEAEGAGVRRMLWDRAYKEKHRAPLTRFYNRWEQERPNLPQEQFLSVVRRAGDVDVLFLTGMRDEAPLATFSHLVPESRVIEVYVEARDSPLSSVVLPYRRNLIFKNEMAED
jgi:hypothetical protein